MKISNFVVDVDEIYKWLNDGWGYDRNRTINDEYHYFSSITQMSEVTFFDEAIHFLHAEFRYINANKDGTTSSFPYFVQRFNESGVIRDTVMMNACIRTALRAYPNVRLNDSGLFFHHKDDPNFVGFNNSTYNHKTPQTISKTQFSNPTSNVNSKESKNTMTTSSVTKTDTSAIVSVKDVLVDAGSSAIKEATKRNMVRGVAKTMVQGMARVVESSNSTDSRVVFVGELLKEEEAEIFAKGLFGLLQLFVPQLQNHPKAKIVGEECRTQFVEDSQQLCLEKFAEVLGPVWDDVLKKLDNDTLIK